VGFGGLGTVIIALVAIYFGQDPSVVLQQLQQPQGGQATQQPYQESAREEERRKFIGVVLADTEEAWTQILAQSGVEYQKPRLVLFSGAIDSACGYAQAAVGPFYCPGDHKVYIDLSFYDELRDRFGAPGDFAQAYVIAHEVGHHVQTLLGTMEKYSRMRQDAGGAGSNSTSVRIELQADCYAGIWAHNADQARQLIEAGDIQQGLNAASAIGDDRLQKQSQGYVTPESFTHGSSEQRVRWFKRGYDSGELNQCDTFGTRSL
jgi:predicted metalloprotease